MLTVKATITVCSPRWPKCSFYQSYESLVS